MEVEDENVVESTSTILKAERACTDVTTVSSTADESNSHKLQTVLSIIAKDLLAADLKWSLFVAASQNYKRDSCLRPFPPIFLKDGNKDFASLTEAVEAVPVFSQLETLGLTLPKLAVELLYWVLIELKEPSLSVLDKSLVESVLRVVPSEMTAPSPSLVVRLSYEESSASELRWSAAKHQHGSIHAFHGSKVENFHSILHHGLQQHLTKNALFGQGIYLSSELLVCLPYSRNGFGWSHSALGSEFSLVALCEVTDHPSVRCQDEGDKENRSRARATDSIDGEVPHKLYLVPNSDLVRVRYLLVYGTQTSPNHSLGVAQNDSRLVRWLTQHKMVALLFGYAVMLAAIGLSRSPTMFRLWRELCRKLGIPY